MWKWICILSAGVFILSCDSDSGSINKLQLEPLFHDNSSKVWLLENQIIDGIDRVEFEFKEKELFIFYNGGDVYQSKVKYVSSKRGFRGRFSIQNENKEFVLDYDNKKLAQYKIRFLSEDSVWLENKEFGRLKLIPLPKF